MSTATTSPRPPRTVHCPQCGKTVEWSLDNPFRPFCSPRCKQIDFGAWASGAYRVPVTDTRGDSEDGADEVR
jgi:endogenous inhibitor of DNA gyrase (YacG/DUF329 family)